MARRSASLVPAKASNGAVETKIVRCAIYTRKSTEEGLQQEFNSLDAQRKRKAPDCTQPPASPTVLTIPPEAE